MVDTLTPSTQPMKPLAVSRDTLTLEELAQRLGISMTVAYELANRDDLPVPVIRVGRRFLFSRHAYDALMAAQRAGGNTPINGA